MTFILTHLNDLAFCFSPSRKFKLKWKKNKNWITVCDGISQTCCDMTALNLHYHGIFMFRVQASSGRNHSDWAIKEFCPDKEGEGGNGGREWGRIRKRRINDSFQADVSRTIFYSTPWQYLAYCRHTSIKRNRRDKREENVQPQRVMVYLFSGKVTLLGKVTFFADWISVLKLRTTETA